MSLAIRVDKIEAVLLTDGEWYEVQDTSFSMDSYEYVYEHENDNDFDLLHGGGQSGICANGFRFKVAGEKADLWLSGPLSSIVAVQEEIT